MSTHRPPFPPILQANGLPPPPSGGAAAARVKIDHKFGPADNFPLSADEYRAKHELRVVSRGGAPPAPLQTFESTGFSEEIMREVRERRERAVAIACA